MKNIDLILRTMGEVALESRKFPKKVSGNSAVMNQLLSTVQAAELTQHAQRHNKNAVNEIFDRSTLIKKNTSTPVTKISASTAGRRLATARAAKSKAKKAV